MPALVKQLQSTLSLDSCSIQFIMPFFAKTVLLYSITHKYITAVSSSPAVLLPHFSKEHYIALASVASFTNAALLLKFEATMNLLNHHVACTSTASFMDTASLNSRETKGAQTL